MSISLPSLSSALEIKEIIDNIGTLVDEIGYAAKSLENEFNENYDEDDEEESDENEDEEQKHNPRQKVNHSKTLKMEIEKIKRTFYVSDNVASYIQFENDMTISVNGETIPISSLTSQHLKDWYEIGNESTYGDNATLTTRIDHEIRSAKDITDFIVSDSVIRLVENLWTSHFYPSIVKAKPYKIAIYGPDDHFTAHRDTAEADLVGTFLLGLGDTSDGQFEFGYSEQYIPGGTWYRSRVGTWCAFFPAEIHRVTKLTQGYRATLAFKIFDSSSVPHHILFENERAIPNEALESIQKVIIKFQKPFGLILHHQYAIDTQFVNGIDYIIETACSLLMKNDTTIILYKLPVVITYNNVRSAFDSSENSSETSIYPLIDPKEDLPDWISSLIDENSKRRIPFYSVQKNASLLWKDDEQESAEHTGNESRPYSRDSIYLSFAIVVCEKK